MADYYEGPNGRKRLLRTYEQADLSTFTDLLYCCAITIEDGLILGGSVPGVDYTRIKLFELAMPLAITMRTEATSITQGIPDSHPHAGLAASNPIDRQDETLMKALLEKGPCTAGQLVSGFKRPMLQDLDDLIKRGLVSKTLHSKKEPNHLGHEMPTYYVTPKACLLMGKQMDTRAPEAAL